MSNDNKMLWYVVQTYSGCEDSVRRDIERKVENLGLQDNYNQMLSPDEEKEIIKEVKGKEVKKIVKEKVYPGYLFIECIMDKDFWFIIRNTQNVTGLLGSSGKGTLPVPVPQHEIDELLLKAGKITESEFFFNPGDIVRVKKGPHKNKELKVIECDMETKIVYVEFEFLGRKQPLELSILEVVKV